MSHFYGTLQGIRGQATRCGGKGSGLTTQAAGWRGAIRTEIWHDEASDRDMYRVWLTPWHYSGGKARVIAEGVLDSSQEAA